MPEKLILAAYKAQARKGYPKIHVRAYEGVSWGDLETKTGDGTVTLLGPENRGIAGVIATRTLKRGKATFDFWSREYLEKALAKAKGIKAAWRRGDL
jgi:hypothetical protein